MYACVSCVCSAWGGQKMSDPLTVELQMLTWNLLNKPGWLQTRRHLSAPASWAPGLKTCATTPSSFLHFKAPLSCYHFSGSLMCFSNSSNQTTHTAQNYVPIFDFLYLQCKGSNPGSSYMLGKCSATELINVSWSTPSILFCLGTVYSRVRWLDILKPLFSIH